MKRFDLHDTEDHVNGIAIGNGTRLVPAGSVFVVVRGMILAHSFPVCIAGRPMAFNQDVKALVADAGVRSRFAAHWMHGRADALLRITTESTHGTKRLAQSDLQAVTLDLPPIQEQGQIASVLDAIDDSIRRTEQIIAKLKLVKQGLLHDLLTRGIDENGSIRDPQRYPEQFRNSSIGIIPKNWDVTQAGVEYEIASGITLGPHRRPRSNPWPYLRVANVFRYSLELADIATLDLRPAEHGARTLEPGDLLIVEGNANPEEIGRCAMATEAVRGFAYQNHLFRLRPVRLVSEFGLYWMNSRVVRAYWRRVCVSSSGLNTINQVQLRGVPVAVPPRREQDAIVSRVASLSERLEAEERTAAKLHLLKQALMDDLLTGRVRTTALLADDAALAR